MTEMPQRQKLGNGGIPDLGEVFQFEPVDAGTFDVFNSEIIPVRLDICTRLGLIENRVSPVVDVKDLSVPTVKRDNSPSLTDITSLSSGGISVVSSEEAVCSGFIPTSEELKGLT